MGHTRHHAIIVTSFGEEYIKKAHEKAIEVFTGLRDFPFPASEAGEMVTPILCSPVNAWYTFFVGPDGSKEGWADSDRGDDKRSEFVEWLKNADYFYWAEVMYHDEEWKPALVDFGNKGEDE